MAINSSTVMFPKGEVKQYRIGEVNLHACINNDPMSDTVIMLEKAGRGVVIDPPSFRVNIRELSEYIEALEIVVEDVILDYHMAGASFLPNARKWSTRHAQEFAVNGAGKDMVQQFAATFGDAFDSELHAVSNFIDDSKSGEVELAGIVFQTTLTHDAFDIVIPEINCVYIHMLGHGAHSIIGSVQQAADLIAQLQGYIEQKCNLILSAHSEPETAQDAAAKIAYLRELIKQAQQSKSSKEFKRQMLAAFPNLTGENYLDMTASFLFAG